MNEDPNVTDLAVIEAPAVTTVDALLSKAVEHNISVEGLEKLLAMHERMRAAAAREAFFEALSAFQADCPVIEKGKVAEVKDKTTGRVQYTYRYAPLEDIMRVVTPALRRYGLSVRFDAAFDANPPAQVVTCIVNHRDGHSEHSEFRSPVDTGARMSVMQQAASSLTYGRRYALLNALGIVVGGEDDDAHSATGTPATTGASRGGSRDVLPRGEGAGHAAGTSHPTTAAPPVARGRNLVTIPRPTPAEGQAPATSEPTEAERAKDAAVAMLRTSLITDWGTLLKATGKFDALSADDLWNKAQDVLDAQCRVQYNRPLVEMNLEALRHARQKTDETLAEKGLKAPA